MHSPLKHPATVRPESRWTAPVLYLAVALASRALTFGNPVIHVDEQFYLLVGERMLQGDWPYTDIFDRKPFLLFAINALFALAGPFALITSQLGAVLAVTASAWLLHRIAVRALPGRLALLPGVLYIAALPGFEGIGAQAPVFFTPLVCAAALLTLRAVESGRPLLPGVFAMLAAGLALQIKYTAVFECGFFGLALLWCARRAGWPTLRIASAAGLWIGCALLPSAAVIGGYALAGELPAFWAANVTANLAMASPLAEALPRLAVNLAVIAGLLVCAAAGWPRLGWQRGGSAGALIRLWFAAALFGYIVYGTWYTHYMLPVLAPLAIMAAAGFTDRPVLAWRAGAALLLLSLIACGVRGGYLVREHGNAAQARAIAAAIAAHAGADRRLFIYSGDPAFYRLTGSPLPSPYVFPDHYSRTSARRFMPLSPPVALAAALAQRPGVVMRVDKLYPDRDRESDAVIEGHLARDYALYARLPIGSKHVLLYRRVQR